MSLRSTSLTYRAGEVIALLETIALAARTLDNVGDTLPRAAGNLGDSIEAAAFLASGVFNDMERAIGTSVNDEPAAGALVGGKAERT